MTHTLQPSAQSTAAASSSASPNASSQLTDAAPDTSLRQRQHPLVRRLADRIEKISIVPRGIGALGYTLQVPEEDRFLMIEDEIRGRIATLLGGRAAEELIFGKVSTGASDDIQKATDLAERYVTLYGMSDLLGPIAFEKAQQQFLDGMTNPRRQVSPRITEQIDLEVKAVIENAHTIALEILRNNHQLLTQLAQTLLKQEVLEGETLRSQLDLAQRNDKIDRWLQTGQPTRNSISAPDSVCNGKYTKHESC